MLQGLSIFRATGANLMLPFVLMTLAEGYAMAGEEAQGLESLVEADGLIETREDHSCEAALHRRRGTLLHARRDHAAAEASYRCALAVAQQQAGLWELKAAASLADLMIETGRQVEARDLLSPIENVFASGSAVPMRADAGLLRELRAAVAPRAPASASGPTNIMARPGSS